MNAKMRRYLTEIFVSKSKNHNLALDETAYLLKSSKNAQKLAIALEHYKNIHKKLHQI